MSGSGISGSGTSDSGTSGSGAADTRGWGAAERELTPADLEGLRAYAEQEFELRPAQGAQPLDPGTLADQAWACLNDPDPEIRDGLAYPTLVSLLDAGELDDRLEELGDRAVAGFRLRRRSVEPLGVPAEHLGDPYALRRSFSALVLGEVIARDRVAGAAGARLLPEPALGRWLLAWAGWYPAEPITSSHDRLRGWLHAVAHGADVARELALHPQLSAPELALLLQTMAARLHSLTQFLNQTEDDRLALAALAILSRPELEPDAPGAWLASLSQLWTAARPPHLAGAVLARGVLHSLHLLATTGAQLGEVELPPAPLALQTQIREALLVTYPYAGATSIRSGPAVGGATLLPPEPS
jgi:Protein of unknown function (DUF2785)